MAPAAIFLGFVLLPVVTSSAEQLSDGMETWDIPYALHDYKNHSCRRPCEGSEPQICRYYFLVEHYTIMGDACGDCPHKMSDCWLPQCVPGNGKPQDILTVNRMMPGPDVDVCEDDTIEVVVDNCMAIGEATSIHWHGIKQKGTQHMDGTSMITQCPIHPGSKFKYRFTARDPGTHYWHGHAAMQRALGLFGRLTVRQPKSKDPHGDLYDYDLPEHSILLSDWASKNLAFLFVKSYYDGKRGKPSSLLVNGIGSEEGGPSMPMSDFHVEKGKRYRFRVLTSGIFNCPVQISVDHHVLTIIASDGQNVKPVNVDDLVVMSGERYDFVLHANQDGRKNYWIRFTGLKDCKGVKGAQVKSILRYQSAPKVLPPNGLKYGDHKTRNRRILNGIDSRKEGDLGSPTEYVTIQDLDLLSADNDIDLTSKPADHVHYLSIGASKLVDPRYRRPTLQGQGGYKGGLATHQLNYITSRMPPAPLLTEREVIPRDMFCNNHTVSKDCSEDMCECVHLYPYKIGDVIEFVIVSFSRSNVHPMHMHGHSFSVVYEQQFDRAMSVEEVRAMDRLGDLRRRTDAHVPKKDTIGVRGQSVVIIRIRADNPGFWFFHCHIEFHAETGMAMVLQEGRNSDMPDPPPGFHKCGGSNPNLKDNTQDFLMDMPEVYDKPEYLMERSNGDEEAHHQFTNSHLKHPPSPDLLQNEVVSSKDSLVADVISALIINNGNTHEDSSESGSSTSLSVISIMSICFVGVIGLFLIGYAVKRIRSNSLRDEIVPLAPTAAQKDLVLKGSKLYLYKFV